MLTDWLTGGGCLGNLYLIKEALMFSLLLWAYFHNRGSGIQNYLSSPPQIFTNGASNMDLLNRWHMRQTKTWKREWNRCGGLGLEKKTELFYLLHCCTAVMFTKPLNGRKQTEKEDKTEEFK